MGDDSGGSVDPDSLDVRWFVFPCGLEEEHRCSPKQPRPVANPSGCYGCLHNGFMADLSSIKIVVSAHPAEFGHRVRGPGPKPWDSEYQLPQLGRSEDLRGRDDTPQFRERLEQARAERDG